VKQLQNLNGQLDKQLYNYDEQLYNYDEHLYYYDDQLYCITKIISKDEQMCN